ncbi:unnamed protein product, partial [Brassica oleracea]
LAAFDPTNKKKKKIIILEPIEDSTESQAEKSVSLPSMLTRICAMNLFCFSQWCIYVILSYLFSLQLTVALTKNGEDERGDLKPAFIAAGGNLILEGARR